MRDQKNKFQGCVECMSGKALDSVETLVSILEVLGGENKNERSIRSIGESCGASKSTIHRMLQGLEQEQWVYQDQDSKSYCIGLRFLCLAEEWRQRLPIVRLCEQYIESLAQKCGHTVAVYILDNNRAVCLHKIDSHGRIRIASQIGCEFPLHAGASGKTVLAFSPRQVYERVFSEPLEQYTPYTVTRHDILKQQIDDIRRKGYCISQEEVDPGVAAISAPVLDVNQSLVFVITIAGACFDINQDRAVLLDCLLSVKKSIEYQIKSGHEIKS